MMILNGADDETFPSPADGITMKSIAVNGGPGSTHGPLGISALVLPSCGDAKLANPSLSGRSPSVPEEAASRITFLLSIRRSESMQK